VSTHRPAGRIAVLGAGGFLGSHIVPALLGRVDGEIDAVDVQFGKLETRDARVRRVEGRVEDPATVAAVVDRCDLVLSLTALCNPALYTTKPLEVIDASYTDLVPLVKACAAKGRRLVHFSTCEVYGRTALGPTAEPMAVMSEESTGLFLGPVDRERWTYACAKQLLERVIWAHGRHGDLDFTIVRPFNVIGARMDFLPGVDGEGVPRVLASFMSALLRGEELSLVDGGRQRRSFVSTDDFVDAIARVVERPDACRRQIINVGNPANDVSIRKLGAELSRAFSARVPGARPARFRDVSAADVYGAGYDDTPERIPDIAKARRLLDWSPRQTMDQMLPPIVDDYVVRYAHLVRSRDAPPDTRPSR
jgi:UDP-apiose/xylose synthase